MIGFFVLVTIGITIFLIIITQVSRSYKADRVRLVELASRETVMRIENIRTYGQEENGWRNNFPTVHGWERTTLHVGKTFILVTGKSNFPFIFKSEIQPFVISVNPELTMGTLGYHRIYKPYNIRITDYGRDLELTIKPQAVFGNIKVHLTFENVGKKRLETLFETVSW